MGVGVGNGYTFASFILKIELEPRVDVILMEQINDIGMACRK